MDARAAGRSVAFREFHVHCLTPRVLCTVMDILIPHGFAPQCAIGDHRGGADEPFDLVHGATVMLWLEPVAPDLPSGVAGTPEPPSPHSGEDSTDGVDADAHMPTTCSGLAALSPATSTSRSRSPPAGRSTEHQLTPHDIVHHKWRGRPSTDDALFSCAACLTRVDSSCATAVTAADGGCAFLGPCLLPLQDEDHASMLLGSLSGTCASLPTLLGLAGLSQSSGV